MQRVERKSLGLLECKLDADSSDYAIAPNDWINCNDFRVNTTNTAKGATNFMEAVGSTILKVNPNLPATGVNLQIGSAPDYENVRIVYFVQNSLGQDGIFCYDVQQDTVFTVLLASQVVGGLNFNKENPIHSAFVINGCAYWVNDNLNQPRRIDIDAGIKMNHPAYSTTKTPYVAPLSQAVITWIRRQPGIPPTAVKVIQTIPVLTNNFIQDSAFQFAWRYIYRNYETGTLSGLSNLCNYDSVTDSSNRIDVTMPLQEYIDQDVIQVDLVVKIMDSGQYFVIKSWLSSVTADAAAIASHNAGTTALSFSFYNDKLGEPLDPTYSVKQYDTVPIYSYCCEVAKSRGFMCNYIAGYDTPGQTSLAISQVSGTAAVTVTGRWFFFKFKSVPAFGAPTTTSVYIMDISDIPDANNPGYYFWTGGAVPPFPGSVPWAQCQFLGAGLTDVMNYYAAGQTNSILQYTYQNVDSTITGAPAPPALIGKTAFKSASPYSASITFYDNWGRKCGLLTDSSLQTQIPERTYNAVSYITSIDWTLDNTNALLEIPVWAAYYSVNLSLNLRTRFFLQARTLGIKYATIDPSTGNYLFTSTSTSPSNVGVGIDLTLLTGQGMGYIFTAGDIVKLYTSDGNQYNMSIIAQQGQWIVCQLTTIPNIAALGFKGLFEIYTPYTPTIDEASYERNQIFPVINPGLNSRQYSVIVGSLKGDITLLNRNDGTESYLTEAMSPNDKLYKNWWTDAGRPNFTDTIGQQSKTSTVTWSATLINGSKVNGLSTFDALDTKDLTPSYGAISKIILTSKAQKTGTVMLAIGAGGEVASLYLNENIITTTTGDTQITQTTDVIGYVNTLKGSYGTVDPTSVVKFRGNVYWYDRLNGKFIQYSDAGLFPISNYKMTKYWKLFSNAFSAATKASIEALGSRPFVFCGIDPHNGELLVTVPRVLADPPKGYFTDYTPRVPYPFDIWDGQSKTLVYKLEAQPNKWTGAFSFKPEGHQYMEDFAYSFYQGNIYLHNDPNSQCNYYGVQYKPQVMLVANQLPNKVKTYTNLNVQASVAPDVIMRTFNPVEQSCFLASANFTQLEGVFYGQIYRDRLTAGYLDYDTAMFSSPNVLRSPALYMQLQFDASSSLVQLKFAGITYAVSIGQVPA